MAKYGWMCELGRRSKYVEWSEVVQRNKSLKCIITSHECPKPWKTSLQLFTYLLDDTSTFTFIAVVPQPQKLLIIDLKKLCDPPRMLLSAGKKALE